MANQTEYVKIKEVLTVAGRYKVAVEEVNVRIRSGRLIIRHRDFNVFFDEQGNVLNKQVRVWVTFVSSEAEYRADHCEVGFLLEHSDVLRESVLMAVESYKKSSCNQSLETTIDEGELQMSEQAIEISEIKRDGYDAFLVHVRFVKVHFETINKRITAEFDVIVTSDFDVVDGHKTVTVQTSGIRNGITQIRTGTWTVHELTNNKVAFATICDAVQQYITEKGIDPHKETKEAAMEVSLLALVERALEQQKLEYAQVYMQQLHTPEAEMHAKKKLTRAMIDRALDERNRELFYQLANELQVLEASVV